MIKKIIYIFILLLIFSSVVFLFLSKKETIAIIGAMDVEIEEILANLSCINQERQDDFSVTTGNLGKYRIVLSKSGVGKVNASSTTQFIIDKYSPQYIINIGIAGSLDSNLKAGETIIASKLFQHDFDVTAFGNPKGYMDNGIEPDKPTAFYSDKNLVKKFISKYPAMKTKTIVTGDIFVTDINLKNSIKKEFGADAIDMESAAIAQTAQEIIYLLL